MPKSKETLDSDDSYGSNEDKPRTKKQKLTTAAAKKSAAAAAAAPPTKNGKRKIEEDEDENEENEEVEEKTVETKKTSTKKKAPVAEEEDDDETENPAGDGMYTIGKLRFVNVNEFRGKAYVNIREYFEKDGKTLPGKKGISLNIEQWEKLKQHIEKIDRDLKKFK